MINRLLLIVILSQSFNLWSQPADTLSLEKFLSCFNKEFVDEFDFGWTAFSNNEGTQLNFIIDSSLYGTKIRLENKKVIGPIVYGWPHSYKKWNDDLFWFVTYSISEGSSSQYVLNIVNINDFSKPVRYYLAYAGGDGGFWGYKYGFFVNDTTFNYTQVGGEGSQASDSIIGTDIIYPNGKIIKEYKKNFLE